MARQNASLITTVPSNTVSSVVQMVGYGPTSQRPANPPLGFIYTDITVGQSLVWHGPVIQWLGMGSTGPQGPQGVQGAQGVSGLNIYFESPQLIQVVTVSTEVASWTEINLASAMAAFGITSARAVILQIETGIEAAEGDQSTTLRVSGSNTIGTTTAEIAKVYSRTGTTDRRTSDSNNAQVFVPFVDADPVVYYNFTVLGGSGTRFGRIYVVGFLAD